MLDKKLGYICRCIWRIYLIILGFVVVFGIIGCALYCLLTL